MGLKEAVAELPLWVRLGLGAVIVFSSPAFLIIMLLLSPLIVPAVCGFAIYYFLWVASKPTLHFAPTHFNRKLVNACPSLHKPFFPTPWASNAHVQNAMTDLRSAPDIVYSRTKLPVHDDGVLSLDWLAPPRDAPDVPTLVVFHGLTGGSHEAYVRHLVKEVHDKLGWRCVVQNFRGCNSELHSARTYCAADTRDCKATLAHVRSQYPKSEMYAVGFSLGSNILVKAAGELGKDSPLSAVVSVSNPWNLNETSAFMKSNFMGRVYSKILAKNLKRFVQRNIDAIVKQDKVDVHKGLAEVQTVSEFDHHFTRSFFGYDSVEHYYSDASSNKWLPHITTPTIVLNARDDPICFEGVIPVDIASRTSHAILVTTARGGHVSWLEGWWGERSWSDRVITEFLSAIHTQNEQKKSKSS